MNPFLDSLCNFGFKNIVLTPGVPKGCFQHPQDVVSSPWLVQIGQDLSEIIKINLDLNLSVINLNLFFLGQCQNFNDFFFLFLGTWVDQQNVEFGWRFNTITRPQPLQPLWNYRISNVTPQCWRPCCTSWEIWYHESLVPPFGNPNKWRICTEDQYLRWSSYTLWTSAKTPQGSLYCKLKIKIFLY